MFIKWRARGQLSGIGSGCHRRVWLTRCNNSPLLKGYSLPSNAARLARSCRCALATGVARLSCGLKYCPVSLSVHRKPVSTHKYTPEYANSCFASPTAPRRHTTTLFYFPRLPVQSIRVSCICVVAILIFSAMDTCGKVVITSKS